MENGVCVVQCEVALLLSAMRRGSRWTGHARSVSGRVWLAVVELILVTHKMYSEG